MWSVSWYVICHKSVPSNTRFFPSVFAAGNSTSEPILFSSQHAPFLFLWSIFYYIMLNQLVNLTSVFVMLFVKCFLSHMLFINRNLPAKWDELFIWEKTSHQSEIPVLWKWDPCQLGEFIFILLDFDFSIEFFYNVRFSLCWDVFSAYKQPLTSLMD